MGSNQEDEVVENFLHNFAIENESSTLPMINIILMLKAMPDLIVEYNVE
jgi:hypothetical protein